MQLQMNGVRDAGREDCQIGAGRRCRKERSGKKRRGANSKSAEGNGETAGLKGSKGEELTERIKCDWLLINSKHSAQWERGESRREGGRGEGRPPSLNR